MKTKIQIKSRWFGTILFEYEREDNTIKDTLVEAVKQYANLRYANLRYADLSDADLRGANLRGANLRYANLRYADLSDADLRGANLRYADLSDADLRGANLRYADLRDADLSGANLSGANLSGADLRDADLNGANLRDADLRDADLSGANLSGANLRDADLNGANLRYADLSGANLRDAKEIPYVPFACPSDGAFIGWKKVRELLVKLEIPEDAKRCSAASQKCRCEKAKVLAITDLDGNNPIDEILNTSQTHQVLYKVGEMVFPDSFDENRWEECSHGIHFFINKQDAINY